MAPSDLACSVNPLALKGRRHPDVGHDDVRLRCNCPLDEPVVVCCRTDYIDVGLQLEEGADAFPNNQVVVREEDRDSPLIDLEIVAQSERVSSPAAGAGQPFSPKPFRQALVNDGIPFTSFPF
jgi:hypothetical protein